MPNDEATSFEIKHWLLGSGVAGIVIFMLLVASQYVVYEDDPYQLVRYTIQHIIVVLLSLVTLSGVILFLEWITDYDLLNKIGEDSKATALFTASVIFCITLLFVYA